MAGRRRPTVYDVAERAGVSIATVSFSFRRPEQVREETRNLVLQAAREIGYIPSASARSLAHGRTGALGLHSFDLLLEEPQGTGKKSSDRIGGSAALDISQSMIPWDDANDDLLSNPRAFPLYVDEVQRGFELECNSQGRPVLLSSGEAASTSVTETAGRVDGLAIFPAPSGLAALEHVSLTMPVVLFSTPPADDGHHRVLVDNDGGMRELITHLVRDHGTTDLGFVGALSVADFRERFTAMQSTLRGFGLPAPDQELDATILSEGREFPRVLELLRSGKLPGGLVCASDQLALNLVDLLQSHGVRVPKDVVVTGFDGILAGRLSEPSLTTVRQPMETMGRVAARLLMDETSAPTGTARIIRLGTKLVLRSSCGCPARPIPPV
ncbi:MAG: LacI family DNA-binding transcriptional regulator [Microbacterium sp.]